MSTTPRVSSAVPGQPPSLGTALAHEPVLANRFYELYGTFWSHGVVAQRTKEVARMRNARITDCGFCKMVRFDGARAEGLAEEIVDDIEDNWQESARLAPHEKVALELTDAMIGDPASLTAEQKARIRETFSDAEIVELALGVGLFLGMAKVLITLGMEPNPGEMPTTIVPTPGSYRREPVASAAS